MDNKGYFESPEFREILKKYEQAYENGSCSYFGIYELCDILAYYLFQDNISSAEEVFAQAQRLHPDAQELTKMEVKLLLGKNEPELALAKLNETGFPDDDETRMLQAETLIAMKEYKEANAIVLDILNGQQITKETACDALELMLDCGFAQDALQITEYALQKYPEQRCFLEIKGECLIELQHTSDAIDIYNTLLDIDPYSTFYWEQLAHIYYMVNKYGKALECFEYELAIGEEIDYARMMQAYCYYFMRDYKKAEEIFETFTRKYPSSVTPHFYIGLCQWATGNRERALEKFDQAIKLAPEESIEKMMARINRAIILYRMGEKGLAEGAISLAILMHNSTMRQLLIPSGELYELRDKENLTFKEMNIIDVKDWSREEELLALANHFMKNEMWELAKSVLLYIHPVHRDPAETAACIAYCFYKTGNRDLYYPYIECAINGRSNLLFDLFGLVYNADTTPDEFISIIEKG